MVAATLVWWKMNSFWEALCAVGHRLADRRGQGTVEYLGLVLAVGALLLAVSVQVKGGGRARQGHVE